MHEQSSCVQKSVLMDYCFSVKVLHSPPKRVACCGTNTLVSVVPMILTINLAGRHINMIFTNKRFVGQGYKMTD